MSKLATKTFTNSGSLTVPAGITRLMCFVNPTTTFFGSFSQISGGSSVSYGLKTDGSAWAWGSGTSGELGNNGLTDISSPVSVVGNNSYTKVSGMIGAIAIRGSDKSAWTWGLGSGGQLGNNTTTGTSSPVSVAGNHSFVTVISNNTNCGGIRTDGSAWCWGPNTTGQIGDNTITNRSSPVSVVGTRSYVRIAFTSNGSAIAIQGSDGSAWGWGSNGSGQLGTNTITNISSPVSVLGNISFSEISSNSNFFLAIRGSDGSAWACGQNNNGQIGDNTLANKSSPVSVAGNNSYISISAGSNGGFAIRGNDGSLWAWGLNSSGQLGSRVNADNASSPVSVVGRHSFVSVSAGKNQNIMALKADGSIWTWGTATSGVLGLNAVPGINIKAPVNISNFSNNSLRYLTVTPNSSVSVTLNAGIWTMTSGNFTNVLGFGDQLTLAWVE